MSSETPNSGGMNALLAQTLTVYGETMSAQVRDTEKLSGEAAPTLVLHHLDGAPRSTEDGHPYVLTTTDAILLRDVLNAATARRYLPPEHRRQFDRRADRRLAVMVAPLAMPGFTYCTYLMARESDWGWFAIFLVLTVLMATSLVGLYRGWDHR